MNEILGLVVFMLFAAAYFAPTIVAGLRQHHQLGPIAVINFFLGWTLIGWVVAMAMAAGAVRPPVSTYAPPPMAAGDFARFMEQTRPLPPAPSWPPTAPHGERPEERSA